MKRWNLAFNAQGLKVIIVVKIYAIVVEVIKKKGRGDETQFTTKIGGKTNLSPNYFILQNFIPSYTFDALVC